MAEPIYPCAICGAYTLHRRQPICARFSVLTELSGSNRLGLMVVVAVMLVGFALLWPVREERAQRID